MSELLRALTDEDVDDEALQAAADAAFAALEEHGVNTEGVAPVRNEAASAAGQRAIDGVVGADGPELELILSPIASDARRLRIREAAEPGAAFALEESTWTGCAWRAVGREQLERVEIDGVAYHGDAEVITGP